MKVIPTRIFVSIKIIYVLLTLRRSRFFNNTAFSHNEIS